ncbi:tetratricopeptide repeat protein [Alicyclobacillus acidocaldarius]|uniref:TPR repeat-containing protein n=1 Tax=Alicyclobacillus acidocaldarius subsp. acidocaldarius (strain ATCC 27009 / DSM 446 / BCRC 14685 / JCM 5260 / KCTC 1825 / NBRC 15652 / NCIMB 11725 / NRRL B-14509 / 104-IA) TaxID=521098 RepID=C8WRF1_ALIAD|nr:tetratricopeptide repeat protein [Alicyclobacillus acidocaldarius]ACV57356.1 TPR repeat-containing protein [Alicyclobacillus acidocaldarius subsp. acidocaldarius DSM 446]
MNRKLVVSAGCAALMAGLVAGCGTANNTTNPANTAVKNPAAKSNTTVVQQGHNNLVVAPTSEVGSANLKRLTAIADKQPSNFEAQLNAADSASANGNTALAIQYFKRAVQANPKSGLALTALGNMYRERENQPKEAIPYYQKSIQVDPSYGWAYWQLAQAYLTLKETSLAKQTLEQGLKNVSKKDTAYADIQSALAQLNGSQKAPK